MIHINVYRMKVFSDRFLSINVCLRDPSRPFWRDSTPLCTCVSGKIAANRKSFCIYSYLYPLFPQLSLFETWVNPGSKAYSRISCVCLCRIRRFILLISHILHNLHCDIFGCISVSSKVRTFRRYQSDKQVFYRCILSFLSQGEPLFPYVHRDRIWHEMALSDKASTGLHDKLFGTCAFRNLIACCRCCCKQISCSHT